MSAPYGTRTNRAVWAAVTRRPRASIDELAGALDLPRTTVRDALRRLRAAGYIDFEPGSKRARTVHIPFIVTKGSR